MADSDVVPRVAIKSHLDGDPQPRPDEVAEWDAIRAEHGIDVMVAIILLPDELQEDGPFPGYTMHGWGIREGRCWPEEIDVEVVPDGNS